LTTNSLDFCLYEKVFLLHFLKVISQGTEFMVDSLLFSSPYTKYFAPFSSHLLVFLGEGRYNSCICPSGDKAFFSPYAPLSRFFFIFDFMKFDYDMPPCPF
jgi:hypothetical protein